MYTKDYETIYFCCNCDTPFKVYGASVGKYCGRKCEQDHKVFQKLLTNPSICTARTYMKRFVKPVCSKCNITEWCGKPIIFQMDHIDGDLQNNLRENLRWLCPNCHTQTSTWGVRNISESGRKRMNDGGIKGNKIRNQRITEGCLAGDASSALKADGT